ncbi:MAG: sigma-70 family RNA polymerase sigma factor [Chloroflexi bacterium]|nr:sigma-70 family RNA polymerase sigma factor [Chloroflexota bacterium]
MPEAALLDKARSFDRETLGEIYDRYRPGVYRYALRLLGEEGLAEECVADTFYRFLKSLQLGGGPQDHLQAYLYRIAHNWITDQYRRQPPPPLPLMEELKDDQDDPAQAAQERIRQTEVRHALIRLTPDQRQVVILKFLEGWDNEAIAQMLERPVSAIKALQHRALGSLRRMLLRQEQESDELI